MCCQRVVTLRSPATIPACRQHRGTKSLFHSLGWLSLYASEKMTLIHVVIEVYMYFQIPLRGWLYASFVGVEK